MQNNHTGHVVAFDDLVRELLGLDPSALAKLSPAEDPVNGATCAGLRTFMRRTLERSLSLIGEKEAALRLHTETSARAQGWPDRATADLHALIVWSLIREPRRWYGSSFVPLLGAEETIVEFPQKIDQRFLDLATCDLVATARENVAIDIDLLRNAEIPANPVSICGQIRKLLKIEPDVLMHQHHRTRQLAAAAFARDPEGQAAAGLTALLISILHTYRVMSIRQIDRIRLMSEADARDGQRPSARSGNMATLLAAALLAEGGHKVRFEPPQERSKEQKRLLRAAARCAYMDGGHVAQEGFGRLADGHTHFGSWAGFSLGDRLMHSVARECDPKLERMPLLVAVQEARTLSSEADALDMMRRAVARRQGESS